VSVNGSGFDEYFGLSDSELRDFRNSMVYKKKTNKKLNIDSYLQNIDIGALKRECDAKLFLPSEQVKINVAVIPIPPQVKPKTVNVINDGKVCIKKIDTNIDTTIFAMCDIKIPLVYVLANGKYERLKYVTNNQSSNLNLK
jgi:hypothetical protein